MPSPNPTEAPLLRSSLKLSVASPKFIVSILLREIIRHCVSDEIAIRRRVQCVNDTYALHTRHPVLSATMSISVSKRDGGTFLLCTQIPHHRDKLVLWGTSVVLQFEKAWPPFVKAAAEKVALTERTRRPQGDP